MLNSLGRGLENTTLTCAEMSQPHEMQNPTVSYPKAMGQLLVAALKWSTDVLGQGGEGQLSQLPKPTQQMDTSVSKGMEHKRRRR